MLPKKFYHIYNHANGKENLFQEAENYRFFLEKYDKYITPVAETFAYCLMPNHFHLVIRIKDQAEIKRSFIGLKSQKTLQYRISKQFANFFSSYTQSFNRIYKRMGSLFNPNFKKKEIDEEDDLTALILYVHSNPVTHGFVKRMNDWPWSSYKSIMNNDSHRINSIKILNWFGGRSSFENAHKTLEFTNATFQKFKGFGKW
jgi:putative transposase